MEPHMTATSAPPNTAAYDARAAASQQPSHMNQAPMGYGMPQMQQSQMQQPQPSMMQQQYAQMAPAPMIKQQPDMTVSGRATQLFAVCETCMTVHRMSGFDMSFRRVMERKCPRCVSTTLTLPKEIMEMLILYGHFIPETVAASIALGTTVTHPSLRGDFVAAVMNELLVRLQTDYVYDVALPKRREGLGMSLRMHKGDLMVGGLIDMDDGTESPSVAARVIAVGDVLVAINKKSITSSSFEKSIRMLSAAASPVYLTFRRSRPVTVL